LSVAQRLDLFGPDPAKTSTFLFNHFSVSLLRRQRCAGVLRDKRRQVSDWIFNLGVLAMAAGSVPSYRRAHGRHERPECSGEVALIAITGVVSR
jgi:hypothetical protein